MKKIKYVIINILVILIIAVIFEFIGYKVLCYTYTKDFSKKVVEHYPPPSVKEFYFSNAKMCASIDLENISNEERDRFCFRHNDLNDKFTKPSIIVFGCSFAHGLFLEDEQIFSYKLANATQRPVYNKAISGGGIQHLYYLINEGKIFDSMDKTPEYAIYVYIPDHIYRLRKHYQGSLNTHPYIIYNFKNNKLTQKKYLFPLLYNSAYVKKFYMHFDKKNIYSDSKQRIYDNFALVNELFLQSKTALEKRYPGIKFVILKYNYGYGNQNMPEIPFLWKTLEDEGFIIIDTKDLTDKTFDLSYTVHDKYHPNEAAWDLIVPKLVEKLNL